MRPTNVRSMPTEKIAIAHPNTGTKGALPQPETSDITHEARRHVGLRFTIIARMLRSNFDRQVVNLSVTRSQWSMIAVVARLPGATQRTIAEALEMSEASAGRLIDRLCADGLLERRDRAGDRRARAVHLTPAAEPLLQQLGTIARASDQSMLKGFSEDELETLGGLLDRIYANVSRG
jgi:MarR family transcriptional regulator for hemolysin